MTEEKALSLLRSQDARGLDWLIRRYTPYVSAVIANVLGRAGTRQDGEELCADVFLALWQSAGRVQPDRIKGWLGTVARRRAVDRLRQRGVELGTEDDLLTLSVPGPEDEARRRELSRLVRAAVESLGEPDREIFVRFYYYCQTTADIAKEMGLGPAGVRKRLERGREKLRAYLAREEHDDLSDFL